MFITNGKSLFGNTGLIISLLILIILVYFSYNKCYVNNIDGFVCLDPTSKDPNCVQVPAPQSVRIKVSRASVTVNFTIDISNQTPISFIVVLAQYDSDKNNTGNNKFYLSNETVLNPSLASNPTAQSNTNTNKPSKLQSNLCSIVNGKPLCQYVFSNLDVRDLAGNLYYYKIGVSSLYNNNINSNYVMPYNISNSNKMFTLNESIDGQNLNGDRTCNKTQNQISANTYNETISTADGKYELIKSQLGHYPDNLLLDSQTTTIGTLTDLVDKSMAQALLTVNVSVPKSTTT
jgi:hypothetical protein